MRENVGTGGPDAPSRSYRVIAALARPAVRLLFRPDVHGLERVPEHGGFVLSANQLSNLDGFALAYPLYPRQLQWMGKVELFRRPLAPLLRSLGLFPVRRGQGDVEAVQVAVDLARRGFAVGIFPEGTRRTKGWRKTRSPRAHSGAARVALAADVPLVPAAIVGTERLMLLRRWRVAFGDPVATSDLDGAPREAAREATRRLMKEIAELESQLQAEVPYARRKLHPRLRLDLSFVDLLAATIACFGTRRRTNEDRVLRVWGASEAIVCLSVRSAFELLLDALPLVPGDEIVFTAITHPDMVRIAEARGLVPVPIDLDRSTLAPEPGALQRVVSERTRMLVVAHLFGARVDLAPLVVDARRHRLLVVEDCAQCLEGPHDYGDELVDVSLFSFGPIKTATALGGALIRLADRHLAERMRELQQTWPVQARAGYARRLLLFAGLQALAHPRNYWIFARLLAATGRDLDSVVNAAVRGFPGPELATQIRRRPSAPLLALLARRLRAFDAERLQARTQAGDSLAAALPPALVRPGAEARDPTHWLFPVLTPKRAALCAALRRAGFDAAPATSSITSVSPPSGRPALRPTNAEQIMAEIVFLPAYPELGERELARLAAVIAETVRNER
jgi:perosamine synthetase